MLSRVADQLYWMSRYMERAEHTARVLDVYLGQMLEGSPEDPERRGKRLVKSLGIKVLPELDSSDPLAWPRWLALDRKNRSSVLSSISSARENARQVTEQISSEMWEHLNRLYHEARQDAARTGYNRELPEFLATVINGSLLCQGVTGSTMNRGDGWRFIRLGMFIERAGLLSTLLDVHVREFLGEDLTSMPAAAYQGWLGLLRSCNAFEGYGKVYTADLRPERIVEFLLLNRDFPHSVRFAVDQIEEALHSIPETIQERQSGNRAGRLKRMAGRLKSQLSFNLMDDILTTGLTEYLDDVKEQCTEIHHAVHQVYIDYPIETAIAS
jgi:uncharacterized alpha-E superfamily protein